MLVLLIVVEMMEYDKLTGDRVVGAVDWLVILLVFIELTFIVRMKIIYFKNQFNVKYKEID